MLVVECGNPLQDSERRLNAVLNNATVSVFLLDERHHCVYMNKAAEKLTGYSLVELQGRPLHEFVHHTRLGGSRYPLEECPIIRALPEDHQTRGEEMFVHKDGTFYPVAFAASPIHDEPGNIAGTVVEVRDISAEKEAERRQVLLVGELNHRVKNTLAAVQAFAAQSFRSLPGGPEARRIFDARLRALAEAHALLTAENWTGAPLPQIVSRVLVPFADGAPDRFRIEGPPVEVPPKLSLALSLGLHELAMNAVKHGALSNGSGRVQIRWDARDHGAETLLRVRWVERGGPEVRIPQRRGFGTRLIEGGLSREFGGKVQLQFEPEGVSCEIEARLPGLRAPAPGAALQH